MRHPARSARERPLRSRHIRRKVSGLKDASLREIYAEVLTRVGEDAARDGLVNTPLRMEKALHFLTRGYVQTVESVLHGALFDVNYDEMVYCSRY